MSYFPSLDVVANDFFPRKFYTKTVAYRWYGDDDRNTNIYTTELSMIESNGPACWE